MSLSVEAALAAFEPRLPLAVAYSGGADSTALLLACVERWPGRVRAIHVHHGLQDAADDFERHCRMRCAQWSVPLVVCRVQARPAPGQSHEDAARGARYRALVEAARTAWPAEGVHEVALGQHADDQVETVLLALLRGAGLPGLAGMPACWEREGVRFHRPWLRVAGEALRAWLRARGVVDWVEDPTNADVRYTRNRIRHELLPVLQAGFPAFRDTIARSAGHVAEAQRLLSALAHEDLATVGDPPRIAALRQLSAERLANVLRHWLQQVSGRPPSSAQLAELMAQVRACRTRGHDIQVRAAGGRVVRDREVLAYLPAV
jgi:tRNA(Ile)-lysidine synthase